MTATTTKDAAQDVAIEVLKSKVEDLEENQTILFERIRMNEKWIAGAGAVIATGLVILGLLAEVDAKTRTEINQIECKSTRMCLQREGN